MIFARENECVAVLDACVLVPVSLCDLLLRLAEEPAIYRPRWSEEILREMSGALRTKLRRSTEEAEWRQSQMEKAFPEAMITVPPELLKAAECIPDPKDRHVLAAAIMGRANLIVTQNTKHFPQSCVEKFSVVCQTADVFLTRQYHLAPQLMLDKLDNQGAGIAKDREFVLRSLRAAAPEFVRRVESRIL